MHTFIITSIIVMQDLESDSEDAVDLQYQSNNVTLTEPNESSHDQDLDADDEDETVHF